MRFTMGFDSTTRYFIPGPGDKIGPNVVIDQIAEGGMARIYKVKNESLEVTRVIKLMKPNSDVDADRFTTEARISANLNHPNIVHCYYFGTFQHGVPYIEMEYVEGSNLYNLIYDNGAIPIAVAASIILYVCKALQFLHNCHYTLYDIQRQGIVHRDIKPGNILIAHDGTVKLADFGIAKPQDLSLHTSALQVVGSTYYLSPEQLRKDSLDFRTDIYSLGCVFYEMITAHKAFYQDNISDIVMAKLNNDFDKRRLRYFPEKVQSIITQCIQPLPDNRYSSVDTLIVAVESLLKEYAIQNPQQVIYNYIRNPQSFITLDLTVEKKVNVSKITFYFTLFIIMTIIGLTGVLYFKKRGLNNKLPQHESVAEVPPPQQQDKRTDSSETAPAAPPERKIVKTPLPKKKIEKKKAAPVTEPSVSFQVKEEQVFQQHGETTQVASTKEVLETFKNRNYRKCLNLVDINAAENDTLILCYLGALIETESFEKASSLINNRAIDDGYYYFLKGRIAYNDKNFKSAVTYFLKTESKPSFYDKVPYYAFYYLAKSRTELYLKTPNIANRDDMVRSLYYFKETYCVYSQTDECRDVKAILNTYQ